MHLYSFTVDVYKHFTSVDPEKHPVLSMHTVCSTLNHYDGISTLYSFHHTGSYLVHVLKNYIA